MKRSPPRKKQKLFSAEGIATRISEAILLDLASLPQVYETPSTLFIRNVMSSKLRKKFVDPRKGQDHLIDPTFSKFLQENIHMSGFKGITFPEPGRIMKGHSARDMWLLRARALAHFVLGSIDEDEVFKAAKHGPGSTVGVSFADTSMEAKWTYPMTCTEGVKLLAERYFMYDPLLHEQVQLMNSDKVLTDRYRVVRGSQATTVDKDDEIRRLIAKEPTLNMFFQQGLMAVFYERLRSVGLNVETLPLEHWHKARIASITGAQATIDWRSASNCVLTELTKWLLPAKWFSWCERTRSPEMLVNNQWIRLHMFSTMGNAVTFPLELLTFWVIAISTDTRNYVGRSLFPEWDSLKTASVFGDDCIVDSVAVPQFIEACQSVGFILNKDKTHADESDRFRESCGGDFLRGINVRPFYMKAPTSERLSALGPWLYVIMNGVIPLYIQYFGHLTYIYDKRFFTEMSKLFSEHDLQLKVVPRDSPLDSGLVCRDYDRLLACYGFPVSPVSMNQHGTYRYTYHRFVYWERSSNFSGLRYADQLRNWVHPDREKQEFFAPIRRRGGYVVASGYTCFW